MKQYLLLPVICLMVTFVSEGRAENSTTVKSTQGPPSIEASVAAVEGMLDPFLGAPAFAMENIFDGERFPNLVVGLDGTVVASWGRNSYKVRRSEDGGISWGPVITVATPGFHGGGLLVDETNGDMFAFVGEKHPPTKVQLYRSTDNGKTWSAEDLKIQPDVNGNVLQMHMAEHGICLRQGEHDGRLLRPARVYGAGEGYNSAIYSDDGGQNWKASEPFPLFGTGEGAIAELSNGHIYYSSRKHWFKSPEEFTHLRSYAWSDDGGETWTGEAYDHVLPDGPQRREVERHGSAYNGHFGMMAGLVRLPVGNRDILLYSNADTPTHERIRMTVWASFDGGQTWPVKRLVYEGPSAYSSLAAGRPDTPSEGWIFLQFEGGKKERNEGGYLARFNLSWLLEGQPTGSGELPDWVLTGK